MGYSTGIQLLGLLRHMLQFIYQLGTRCLGLDSQHRVALLQSTHAQALIFSSGLARTLWSPA